MNFFHHKDLGNHLLQLCPKVVKHPVHETLLTVIFMVITVHQLYQSLYYPTNAQCKSIELLKHTKIIEAAPIGFDLQRNHHQGATASA